MPEDAGQAEEEQQYPWRDEEKMRKLYEEEMLSTAQIAEELDCAQSTVRNWLNRLDIGTRSISEGIQVRHGNLNKVPFQTQEHRGHETWWYNYEGEATSVYVHRLLAVSEYGADAVAGMHVHHKNEIPWDNRPENIELLTRGQHSEKHTKYTWLEKLRAAEMYRDGASARDIAPVFGASSVDVLRLVRDVDESLIRDHAEATKLAHERRT